MLGGSNVPKQEQKRNPAQRKNFFTQHESPFAGKFDPAKQVFESAFQFDKTGTDQITNFVTDTWGKRPTAEQFDKAREQLPWWADALLDTPVISQGVDLMTSGSGQIRAAGGSAATGGQNTPTEERFGQQRAKEQAYLEATKQADTISALYGSLSLLDQAGLSEDPAYASQIEQLKLTADSKLQEVQRQIDLLQGGGQLLQEQSDMGRQRIEQVMAQFKPVKADLNGSTTQVEQSIQNSLDKALVLPPEIKGQLEGSTIGKVNGGAASAAYIQKQTDAINKGKQDIEAAVSETVGEYKGLAGKVDAAAQKIASNQIELMGLQDAAMREKAQVAMEVQIRNNTWDLVEQRKNIISQKDDAIAALAAEREARAAGNVSMPLPYDPSSYAESVAFNLFDNIVTPRGYSPQEEEMLAIIIDEMYAIVPSGRAAYWSSTVAIDPVFQTLPASKQQEFRDIASQVISAQSQAYEEFDSQNNETSKFAPGSADLASLIFRAGTTGPNALDPQFIAQLAQSGAMHKIIDIQSKGNANYKGKGSLSGLGGLPASVYTAVGIDADTADPVEQMQALIYYLMGAYGGDPVAALENFMQTEELTSAPAINQQQDSLVR